MTADTLPNVWLLRRSGRATHINSECNGICESATRRCAAGIMPAAHARGTRQLTNARSNSVKRATDLIPGFGGGVSLTFTIARCQTAWSAQKRSGSRLTVRPSRQPSTVPNRERDLALPRSPPTTPVRIPGARCRRPRSPDCPPYKRSIARPYRSSRPRAEMWRGFLMHPRSITDQRHVGEFAHGTDERFVTAYAPSANQQQNGSRVLPRSSRGQRTSDRRPEARMQRSHSKLHISGRHRARGEAACNLERELVFAAPVHAHVENQDRNRPEALERCIEFIDPHAGAVPAGNRDVGLIHYRSW
jgi:hypothetical protein